MQLNAFKKINFYRSGKSATKESHTVNFTVTSKPNNFNWQRKSCIVYILLTLYPISSDWITLKKKNKQTNKKEILPSLHPYNSIRRPVLPFTFFGRMVTCLVIKGWLRIWRTTVLWSLLPSKALQTNNGNIKLIWCNSKSFFIWEASCSDNV